MKIIAIAQSLAVCKVVENWKIGKFSPFLKQILSTKNDIAVFPKFLTIKLIFPVYLKNVIGFCLTFLEMRGSTCFSSVSEDFFFSIFSTFKLSGGEGSFQNLVSPIAWMEHIPMEHLDEKYRQIHCKTKLFNPSESQNKKSNF